VLEVFSFSRADGGNGKNEKTDNRVLAWCIVGRTTITMVMIVMMMMVVVKKKKKKVTRTSGLEGEGGGVK
jgi:hypothetical protein